MRILALCGDYWHPADTTQQGLNNLGKYGFTFDWIENANDWSAKRMASYPIAILAKSNEVSESDQSPWATESVQRAFLEYVRKGNGLLVLHSGTAGYEQLPIMRGLMGGAFRDHPPKSKVTIAPRAEHPLTFGCSPFTLMDEHYFMDLDDDQADVFLTTTSEHGTQSGGWLRFEGAGRVCVLTPGHNLEVWLHPTFQSLLHNALRWCCKTI